MRRSERSRASIVSGVSVGLLVLALISLVSVQPAGKPPAPTPPPALPAPTVWAAPTASHEAAPVSRAPDELPSPTPAPVVPAAPAASDEAAPIKQLPLALPTGATHSADLPLTAPAPAAQPSQVDAALHTLVDGTVAFRAPSDMQVGNSAEVKVLVSARRQIGDLEAQLGSGGQIGGGPVLVADRMRATLSGADFSVSPAEPQIQAISRETDNTWTWTVAATKAGDHVLVLRLDVVLKIDGSDTPHFLRTFDRHIEVRVGWPTDVHGWIELARTTADDFKWLITTLAAAGAAVIAWVRRKPHAA